MASVNGISVAIESAVHGALRDLAREVWRQHGIRINSVHFDWTAIKSVDRVDCLLDSVHADTVTYR